MPTAAPPLTHGTYLGRIPYVQHGAAPALLVVNGGQGFVRRASADRAARDARRVARCLPQGTGFVLLGYDPAPAEPIGAQGLVEDLAQIIERHWHGRARLVGLSYGGLIAVRLAARRPELVERLALVASAHRFSAEGERRVRRQIDALAAGEAAAFLTEFAQLFRRPWLNALLGLRLRLGGRRLAAGLADSGTAIAYLSAMLRAEPIDPAGVTAPLMIVGGSADQFFGDAMAALAAAAPDARLRLLAGETHMAPVEQARAIRAALTGFL